MFAATKEWSAVNEAQFVTRLLRRHGLHLNKRLGQHLLVDDTVMDRIVSAVAVGPGSHVVEIGAGIGNLSARLADTGAHITSIELDRRFEPLHKNLLSAPTLSDHDLQFAYEDALDYDYVAAGARATAAGAPFIIAGNIPYQITSPLVMKILESGAPFDRMVLMMQREVAERLSADPGSKRNGAISIKVQFFCDMEPLFDVPPRAFLPPPEVHSLVLSFTRREPLLPADQRRAFFKLVDAAFSQRRKMLTNSVNSKLSHIPKDRIEAALEGLGIVGTARAEQLGLPQFLELYHRLIP